MLSFIVRAITGYFRQYLVGHLCRQKCDDALITPLTGNSDTIASSLNVTTVQSQA